MHDLNSLLLRLIFFLVKLVEHYGLLCERICSQYGAKPTSQDWVGLYRNVEDMMPEWGSLS